jgi:hypothetical protein
VSDERRPPIKLGSAPIVLEGGVMEMDEQGGVIGRAFRFCVDPVHVFEEITGRCQCGDHEWGDGAAVAGGWKEAT